METERQAGITEVTGSLKVTVKRLFTKLLNKSTHAINSELLTATRGAFLGVVFDGFQTGLSGNGGGGPMSVGDDIFNLGDEFDIVMLRPCIEHNMLGIVMGRGGKDDLGATFWGQTELSVYDDGMHGKWGMSYKYHERAIVLNEKNLMRCWDVAFNGYNGGCDDQIVPWDGGDESFRDATHNLDQPFDGPSIICMVFPKGKTSWPNPILMKGENNGAGQTWIDQENINSVYDARMDVFNQDHWSERYTKYRECGNFPDFAMLHGTRKTAGTNSNDSVTEPTSVAFQGTLKIDRTGVGNWEHIRGAGHLGDSYVGCASVREGKGYRQDGAPSTVRMI
jgi:hypothetical protein